MRSGLHYHRFWGLIEQKNTPGNLSPLVIRVFNDESYKNDLFAQISMMNTKSRMMRFIYRLFNVNNYAFHLHLMNVYQQELTLKGQSRMYQIKSIFSPEDQVPGSPTRIERVYAATSSIKNYLTGWYDAGRRWFSSSRQSENLPQTVNDHLHAALPEEIPPQVQESVIKVTREMLPYLKTLNIDANVDDVLKWSLVKKAYRQLALQTHPDKVPGRAEEFEKIHAAFVKLNHPENIVLDEANDFAAEEENRQLFAILVEIRILKAQVKAMMAEAERANAARAEAEKFRLPSSSF